MGEKGNIKSISSWNELAIVIAREIIEDAFDKKLNENYFQEKPLGLFVERDWKGLAIVKDVQGLRYLDKLAVKKEFQNNGVAGDLLHAVFEKHGKVFWRASHKNPVNYWYFKNCTGCIKDKHWNVFWKNLQGKEIDKAVFFALNRKPDFQ